MKKSVKRRRLKKTIRRTIGALFMISAIIIAAIPFPDARAEGEGEGVETEEGGRPYVYLDTDSLDEEKDELSITDPKPEEQDDYAAYTINLQKGLWTLDWQYKYWVPSAGERGWITDFNSEYSDDTTIDLDFRVHSDYLTIDEECYTQFTQDTSIDTMIVNIKEGEKTDPFSKREIPTLNKEFILSGDPYTCPDKDFFIKYFKTDYETYCTQYDAATNTMIDESERPALPKEIIQTYAKVYTKTDEQKQLFCDLVYGTDALMCIQTIRQAVYNEENGLKIEPKTVYALNILNNGNNIKEINILGRECLIDDNGFVYMKYAEMKGVATNAFKGVKPGTTLTIAEEISQICDSAFENCGGLESVNLSRLAKIGNRAFADCGDLKSINLENGIEEIGIEAFTQTSISEIFIPKTVNTIGSGAFSRCRTLTDVQFESDGSAEVKIGSYAFFDCKSLTNINFGTAQVKTLGRAAFAVSGTADKDMITFIAPSYMTDGACFGDYLFGGRSGLKNVIMPKDLGNASPSTITNTIFYGCTGLEWVEFPQTCKKVTFEEDLFKDVEQNNFYVKGPEKIGNDETGPRKSTWNAYFFNNTNNHVPYKYGEGENERYEVSDGTYRLAIDNNGILKNCDLLPGKENEEIKLLPIPEMVGDKPVTEIGDGCFDSVKGKIEQLQIKSSEVKVIGDDAFNGAENLKMVAIGNSVTKIGERAFANCPELENIVFAAPKEGIGSFPIENVGKDAFSTGSDRLTITGEIDSEYGPFAYAMNPDNKVNINGVRICYKSPEPSCLTVILDNHYDVPKPTLIDFPRRDGLSNYSKIELDENGDVKFDDDKKVIIEEFDILGKEREGWENQYIEATEIINVPDGIASIDTKGYFHDDDPKINPTNKNDSSIKAYFLDSVNDLKNGLFKENEDITDVTLNSVEELPDSCFKGCTKLRNLTLGKELKTIMDLPIEDCTSLVSLIGNDFFKSSNGILYEKLPDGTYELVECFASRGSVIGEKDVSVENEPDEPENFLRNVSNIRDAAFRNCKNIKGVDFTDVNYLKNIPESCFENCFLLYEVTLPDNINYIGSKAFKETAKEERMIFVTESPKMSVGTGVFENVEKVTYYEPLDATAGETLKRQVEDAGKEFELKKNKNRFTVIFKDYDGTLIKKVKVFEGDEARAPIPPEKEGLEFTGWDRPITNITTDNYEVRAQYKEIVPGTPGVQPGTPGVQPVTTPGTQTGTTPGATNKVSPTPKVSPTAKVSPTTEAKKYQLTVIYGSGSGQYASGTTVIINAIEPPAGKVFDRWVVTGSGLTIASSTSMATTVKTSNSDATVTATYKNTGSVSGNSSRSSNKSGGAIETRSTGDNKTRVDITKDGISNTDKAYASVKGSSDNFIVKISESADAANQVATALSNQYSDMTPIKYFAMDISLYDATGTNKIENVDGLSINITMPIPDALVQYAGNNKIGAVVNGSLEVLNCKFTTIDGIPCVSFTATHFSPYTVFVDTANLTEGTLDATPKTGDGIHPKWFVVMAFVCISLILLLKKDRVKIRVA